MTTLTAASSPDLSVRRIALIAGAILIPFTVYSLWVLAGFGYSGFLGLLAREPWALQMSLDLLIACSFGIGWMTGDARRRGITSWPFVVMTVVVGSIGLLGYLVWRSVRPT